MAKQPNFKTYGLALQGGGALGAYHVGAYQALQEFDILPDMVSGISIGAINSALIAGNPPEERLEKLRKFWHTISWPDMAQFLPLSIPSVRELYNFASGMTAAMIGQPHFFTPRFLPPLFAPPGTSDATSYSDTSELRKTLLNLIDFDLINRREKPRLFLGVVDVLSGEPEFFDSYLRAEGDKIGPEHVMASGALPPGLPAIRVNGKLYYDGGCASNTPVKALLDLRLEYDTLIFMVDLFDPVGPEPKTIFDVASRQAEIQYASRSWKNIRHLQKRHYLNRQLALAGQSSESQQTDGYRPIHLDIVQLIMSRVATDSSSRNHEFSRISIEERMEAGCKLMRAVLKHRIWEKLDDLETDYGAIIYQVRATPDNMMNVQCYGPEDHKPAIKILPPLPLD
jgi:NTE family protein